jgi:glutamate synthase (NADPH/NADH) large chain
MVKLEAITADAGLMKRLGAANGDAASVNLSGVMSDMRFQDAERLHALIVRHAHYTNSKTAKHILADFAAYLPKFKKVMPTEYARALAQLAAKTGKEKPAVRA